MLRLIQTHYPKLFACIFCSLTFLSHAGEVVSTPNFLVESGFILEQNNTEAPTAHVVLMEEVDVWERMRKGFAIPDLDNPLVVSQTNWYSSHPEQVKRTITRGSRYLFHVVSELEKRGMPTELALLPFIESSFNPEAYSKAKAAGLWQFIPSTGLFFKLKQNVFKDERRDILASTDAALNYLEKLYGLFGDWQLALAAYNWGEGAVQRAIKKNLALGKPTDFNGLSHIMPEETRNYVPKFIAIKNIIANPAQYNIALPKVENQPYFVVIDKKQDIDIKLAAQLAELSLAEFKSLNPQFNRPIIPAGDKAQLLLPHDNAEKFKANLAKWNRPLSSWTSFTVQKRERVDNIAKAFRTLPEVLREANRIPPKMLLKPGSTILVPKLTNANYKDISPELIDNAVLSVEPEIRTKQILIKVKKKDTLASVAQRYKVSTEQIKEWNNLKQDRLTPGQKLKLEVQQRAGKKSKHKKPRYKKRYS
jgi:membrane-bound lytic murein transglycosylase D